MIHYYYFKQTHQIVHLYISSQVSVVVTSKVYKVFITMQQVKDVILEGCVVIMIILPYRYKNVGLSKYFALSSCDKVIRHIRKS